MKAELIVLVFLLFGASTVVEARKREQKEPFTLDDFLNGTYVNRAWNGMWISDETFIYKDNKAYYTYNVTGKKPEEFLQETALKEFKNPTLTVSNDQQYALIKYDVKSVFRHSTTAKYAVYDVKKKTFVDVNEKQDLQYCKWVSKENKIIYVFKNNIYYQDVLSVSKSDAIQVTNDGEPGIIYNGIPDWVYEEEVLGTGEAIWVSPDGTKIVYARFDDTEVPSFSYPMYGVPGSMDSQYPEVVTIKYPKAGANNPKFELISVNLPLTPKLEGQKLPEKIKVELSGEEDEILYGVVWNNENTEFKVLVMNRVQNTTFLRNCKSEEKKTQSVETVFKCEVVTKNTVADGWSYLQMPVLNQDGTGMVQIQSSDNFPHVHLLCEPLKQISKGNKTITTIYGYSGDFVYYGGSVEGKHAQQQVFYAKLSKTEDAEEKCLTCNMQTPEGICRYATASFSKDMTYVAKICQGPGPNYVVIERTFPAEKQDQIIWEANTELRKKLVNKLQPVVEDLLIEQTGYSIAVRLLLPPKLQRSLKYPMIVHVYGGPQSNQISDAFSLGFQNYLITSQQIIYAYIDGRGSGRRGDSLMYEIYKRLGTVEIEDQIIATKYLQGKYSFIDAKRIGIWGWSYGGFSTAWAMAKDQDNVFKCGLSVAPVTSFIYYDSIYTERYMDTPEENEEGYNNTDVTRHAENFTGKNFFLIHGNGDDNVHYQQAMMLARALELADVPFKQMSYPDENHSLRGVSHHLYHAMNNFWTENFAEPHSKDGANSLRLPTTLFLFIISVVLFI